MIVLADKGDEVNVVEEEKQEWLNKVLIALGVPEQVFELELEDLRDYFFNLEIEIWSHHDGTVDIHKGNEVVAQWKKPKFVLIKETTKKWYYEIHIDAWARPLQRLEI